MFVDFRDAEDGLRIEADICVIGAGAAGITLARALAGSDIQVVVLESGGFEPDSATQSLYQGRNVGLNYYPLESVRLRYFGGSTNHWGGWCAPLNASDFKYRPWVPHSGWPIDRSALDSYYPEAQRICQLGPFEYDPQDWADEYRRFPSFHPDKLISRLWQFSPPTRFAEIYRNDLKKADNVRVFLNANVTRFDTNPESDRIETIGVVALGGKAGLVRARYYVLACGGLENPRLLLLSNRDKGGLGNRFDRVGRFFMEHPHLRSGNILAVEPRELIRQFTIFHRDQGVRMLAGICPSPAAQAREEILNCSATIDSKRGDYDTGYDSWRSLRRAYDKSQWPEDFAAKLWSVVTDLDDVVAGATRPEGEPYVGPVKSLRAFIRSEQAPNPDSRVSLSERRDVLGLNEIELDWRLTELDWRTLRASNQLLGEELGRLGLGRVQLPEWLLSEEAAWPDSLGGGSHHMGTTRMADDPRRGVVDRDCRMHDVENLFVAGSSVFPTSGYANPTLTIVALALRLADHLREQFRSHAGTAI
jgi:choline dehydrogenase-like flavoprotein